jgi:hypothetical protein
VLKHFEACAALYKKCIVEDGGSNTGIQDKWHNICSVLILKINKSELESLD